MSLFYWVALGVLALGVGICVWIEVDAPATQNPDDYGRLLGQVVVMAIAIVVAGLIALAGLVASFL